MGTGRIPQRHTHRSQDETQSVVLVGDAIAAQLRAAGIGVIHDTTCHDYPAYNGAYDRSAVTMQKNLEKYPGIQVTLDIHRDAIGDNSVRKKPTVTIDGKKAAQIMILSGWRQRRIPRVPGLGAEPAAGTAGAADAGGKLSGTGAAPEFL